MSNFDPIYDPISEYPKLNSFLKRRVYKSDGFTSKKSKILTSDEVEKFLNEAPDDRYLATKVALIFGVVGACRREELANITLKDISISFKVILANSHGDILSQTVNMQPKTSPVSINNCSNFNVYVNYNFYKK
ncbi:hypothetical protein ABMA27_001517 [Loxostege sticticalis]|uniref:Tyr recombinase domain-containing protein n=1 Tax=Loxostege sticticalis TaxID=481309 RepID=A0ABR3HYU4_LOXSC